MPLISLLRDEKAAVRYNAIDTLIKIKDLRAIEPLIAALNDKNQQVRLEAVRALEELTQQKIGLNFERWQKWFEENRRDLGV
jgi:HEAT repeat protein